MGASDAAGGDLASLSANEIVSRGVVQREALEGGTWRRIVSLPPLSDKVEVRYKFAGYWCTECETYVSSWEGLDHEYDVASGYYNGRKFSIPSETGSFEKVYELHSLIGKGGIIRRY